MIFSFAPKTMKADTIRAGLCVLFKADPKGGINKGRTFICYRWQNGVEMEEHDNGLTRIYVSSNDEKIAEVIRAWLLHSKPAM